MADTKAKPTGNWTWQPLLVFAIFVIAITMTGYAVFLRYKEDMKLDAQNDLGGIAALKIEQITNWMGERKGDAQTIMESPFFLAEVDRWLQRGSPKDETRAMLMNRLSLPHRTQADHGYTSAFLFDDKAIPRLSYPEGDDSELGHEKQGVLESMRSGKIIFSDVHEYQKEHGAKHVFEMDLVVPLFVGKGKRAHVIGAVLFHINPNHFLFPLIQSWPTASQSAENMLVRREGDEVVLMNEMRQIKNMPLAMRLPLGRQELLSVKAVMGQQGLAEGVDYRGVSVVGVLSKVPGTSWSLVSKIDQTEIYAPINKLAAWMLGLMAALVGAGGGLTIFWRRKERGHFENALKNEALGKCIDYLAK